MQDATLSGLGVFATRALVADSPHGRLASYEALERRAAQGDWPSFLVSALEYIESAGFDTTRLVVLPPAAAAPSADAPGM